MIFFRSYFPLSTFTPHSKAKSNACCGVTVAKRGTSLDDSIKNKLIWSQSGLVTIRNFNKIDRMFHVKHYFKI